MLTGLSMVKIRKVSGPGAFYYLTALSDERNVNSVWAITHQEMDNDEDEFWNVIPWVQDGKQCYKIEVQLYI